MRHSGAGGRADGRPLPLSGCTSAPPSHGVHSLHALVLASGGCGGGGCGDGHCCGRERTRAGVAAQRAEVPGVRGEDMRQPKRLRRCCLLAGMASSLLVVTIWVLSILSYWCLYIAHTKPGRDGRYGLYIVCLTRGYLGIEGQRSLAVEGWARFAGRDPAYDLVVQWRQSTLVWKPEWRLFRFHFRIGLPLWIPCVLFSLPTTVLWWLDRRRMRLGHCQRCGYNLRGNVSGVCPECGSAMPGYEAKV